ncbi:MAG TPA: LysR family transcriptional regulator [Gemmatimonadales bacterium]|nr:LysR family transcriptional regulator [Gemmatimonadales bacterium]
MLFPDLVPRASVTLMRRGVPVIGEREARLLEAVERVQSIKDAAAATGISYRTAWSAIQQMEKALGRPMVASRAGGPGGGATTLTDECRRLLGVYQDLRRRLDEELGRVWEARAAQPPDGEAGS